MHSTSNAQPQTLMNIDADMVAPVADLFVYFLYNVHSLFHLKVFEISFSNSRLFPHADDPLFQETLSELAEGRSSASVRGHTELHQSGKQSLMPIMRWRCLLAERA
ncbi:hypothetical protein GmHk_20G058666 [Glycine max]|nr:hypothetical protein GmHk_20G058666 [Glycine max]